MLSDFLIRLIVFFLPTQLGLHFWPSFSRVAGIKVDYLSPTLYLVDILLIFLVLLNSKKLITYLRKNLVSVAIIFSFMTLNIIFAVSPLNSLFWWLRSFLYLLTYMVLRLRWINWDQIKMPLLIGTTFVVMLEVIQLVLQSSLGGLAYYLGERAYSASTAGIGRIDLLGKEILRPISTFSHSNSLAGYLLIVFYLFTKKSSRPWYKLIPFTGILLSFSKTATIALSLIIFNVQPLYILITSLLITAAQPLIGNYQTLWQSLSDRLFYFLYLKKVILQNPFTGTGLGNFIPSLGSLLPGSFLTPSKLQPLHNLPYLYISELGIIGSLLLVLTFLKQKVRVVLSNPLLLGLIAITLFTGSFDHYTWTLPQNKLIFLLALSILV